MFRSAGVNRSAKSLQRSRFLSYRHFYLSLTMLNEVQASSGLPWRRRERQMSSGEIIDFGRFVRCGNADLALASEAKAIQTQYGRNPYSEFLLANGRRPDVKQASTIGKLMGAQVLADDGSKQPPLSTVMKRIKREARQDYRAKRQRAERVQAFNDAIQALENISLMNDISVHDLFFLIDDPELPVRIDRAVDLLIRLTELMNEQAKRACRAKELVDREEPKARLKGRHFATSD